MASKMLLFWILAGSGATVLTAGTFTISTSTGVNGISSCNTTPQQPQTYTSCSSSTVNSFATAIASASTASSSVSVSIAGSAWGYAEYAQAAASALLSLDFFIGGAAGTGLLRYDIELSAHHTGTPGFQASSVYFNGVEYAVNPRGLAIVSFTRTFAYGRPFTVDLGVSLRNSWAGFGSESGSSSGSARLVSATAEPTVPEPTTIVLWACGALWILSESLRRNASKR